MKERIEQILEDKRMTQTEFANRAGISPATITHLFNGRNNLSEAVVSKILLAFPEINPIWLLDGRGEKYQKVVYRVPLLEEIPRVEEKTVPLFNLQSEEENIDNQVKKEANSPMISPAEPIISCIPTNVQAIPQGEKEQKQIRKIVFFYTDKTFAEFYPE